MTIDASRKDFTEAFNWVLAIIDTGSINDGVRLKADANGVTLSSASFKGDRTYHLAARVDNPLDIPVDLQGVTLPNVLKFADGEGVRLEVDYDGDSSTDVIITSGALRTNLAVLSSPGNDVQGHDGMNLIGTIVPDDLFAAVKCLLPLTHPDNESLVLKSIDFRVNGERDDNGRLTIDLSATDSFSFTRRTLVYDSPDPAEFRFLMDPNMLMAMGSQHGTSVTMWEDSSSILFEFENASARVHKVMGSPQDYDALVVRPETTTTAFTVDVAKFKTGVAAVNAIAGDNGMQLYVNVDPEHARIVIVSLDGHDTYAIPARAIDSAPVWFSWHYKTLSNTLAATSEKSIRFEFDANSQPRALFTPLLSEGDDGSFEKDNDVYLMNIPMKHDDGNVTQDSLATA